VYATSHPRYVGYVRGPDPLRYGYFEDEEVSLLRIDVSVPESVRNGAPFPYQPSTMSVETFTPGVPKATRPLEFDSLDLKPEDWMGLCKMGGR